MAITSALVDGWVLDNIGCLGNKGLVVRTLALCILCSVPMGHRALYGLKAHSNRQPTKAGQLGGELTTAKSKGNSIWPLTTLCASQTCVTPIGGLCNSIIIVV